MVGIAFDRCKPTTNFVNLIDDEAYNDAIFLFNDNFCDRNVNRKGGGSAAIRPYVFQTPPRAVGISTGWCTKSGGFSSLTEEVQRVIKCAFERVNTVLKFNAHIRRVIFPSDGCHGFGFNIFKPHDDVVDFLNAQLQNVPKRYVTGVCVSGQDVTKVEDMIEARDEFANVMAALRKQEDTNRKMYAFGLSKAVSKASDASSSSSNQSMVRIPSRFPIRLKRNDKRKSLYETTSFLS
jgi:hypothetical protein